VLLDGKRILITGVMDRHSIAYAIAEQAQQQGAEVVLTSFGRVRRITERACKGLPEPPDVLELDATSPEDFVALGQELERRWGGLDAAVHAIAFAPPEAISGDFLATPLESAAKAFEVSAFSLKALAQALLPGASWRSTSTPSSLGPHMTGWGSRRRLWSRWRATWRATSVRAA